MSGFGGGGSKGTIRRFGKWILFGMLGLAFISVIGPLMTFAGEVGNTGENVVNTGTSVVRKINGELGNIQVD